ncbi:MAG TPA: superinfection immunity protein [Gammaproteobacteria bacterium]|nr:superinfection immunity protein [Gammaproteobacteria bacterium]
MELVLVPLILGSYFLPTIIAVQRDHRSSDTIFFVNLFLGITVIGWLMALVWSLMNPEGENQSSAGDDSGDDL